MLNKLDLDKVYQGQTEADGEDYQACSLLNLNPVSNINHNQTGTCPTHCEPQHRPPLIAGADLGELLANNMGAGVET